MGIGWKGKVGYENQRMMILCICKSPHPRGIVIFVMMIPVQPPRKNEIYVGETTTIIPTPPEVPTAAYVSTSYARTASSSSSSSSSSPERLCSSLPLSPVAAGGNNRVVVSLSLSNMVSNKLDPKVMSYRSNI